MQHSPPALPPHPIGVENDRTAPDSCGAEAARGDGAAYEGILDVLKVHLRRAFFSSLPLPVRMLRRFVGRRQYATQHRELFPGRAVPETI